MKLEEITFDQWIAMSEDEQARLESTWNPYAEGYWHGLRAEAQARFEKEFGTHAHVVEVHGGIYHGGMLIIGVTTDLPYPERITEIPEEYAGFPVMQFGQAKAGS